ncbi:GNAT family N-acetyltransferase [Nocardia sp. NPDC050713]|uniref:GNAT family N-acetyltransferase n=1 Tax=Nocardia sp. NPDC050713 TaxID=3154511 RepID=UPI0033CB38E4
MAEVSTRAWRVTPLAAEHVQGLAECHIACWREAYRGLVPDRVLDAFDVDRRAEAWDRVRRAHPGSTHVAVVGDSVVGFASSGPPRDRAPVAPLELNALYVRADWYGTGLARELLDTVVAPGQPCSLWVFEDNPRAQAFYRKHGFALEGARKVEDFTIAMQVRMVRPARTTETAR